MQSAHSNEQVPALPHLPPDVVALLLQALSPAERLTACALVCQSWRDMAAASISSITLSNCIKQRDADQAFQWLTSHGTAVTSVCIVVSEAAERLCLDCHLQPWHWLKDLRLTGFTLQQSQPLSYNCKDLAIAALVMQTATLNNNTTTTKSTSRLGTLTSLTRLELDGCAVPDDLIALSSLTGLEHLTVSVMTHSPVGVAAAPFQVLTKLTYLQLGLDVHDSTLEHLSCLAALQELHISKYSVISSAGMAQLSALQALTLLQVNSVGFPLSPSATPGLSQLPGLQHLELAHSTELNTEVLEALTGLQHLAVIDTPLSPRDVSPSAAPGISALLRLLPRLQQLTSLELTDCLNWPQAAAEYAAMTAPTGLVRLVLPGGHFPHGAARHMFAQGRQLPQLTHFVMHSNWPERVSLEAGDVGRLVRCCPALQQLDVDLGQQTVEQLLPLTQLSALTQLVASGVPGEAALGVLATLCSLRHLQVQMHPDTPGGGGGGGLTTKGMLQLTALTGLTHLRLPAGPMRRVAHMFGPDAELPLFRGLHLTSRGLGPDGDGPVVPDVSDQLAKLLRAASSSAAEATQAALHAHQQHLCNLHARSLRLIAMGADPAGILAEGGEFAWL